MEIRVGNTKIGGDYIPIQSMLKNPVTEIEESIEKIVNLASTGCDIIRITVPDMEAATALKIVLPHSPIPVVADIHFDYKLAIAAIENGVHKVRINPGNIGDESRVKEIISCLKAHNIPVRIGINSGSLPAHLKKQYNDPVTIMIEAAKEEIGYFEKYGYDNIVLSFKSSNVIETIAVNSLARKTFPYPLHIGVTEAGDITDGTIKNTAGISALLLDNIGDTIRVSLTAPEEDEILVGKKILESIGKRKPGLEIISCPTCGRTDTDIGTIVKSIKEQFKDYKPANNLKIAVMGCIVNGPGEAEKADFGVACGKEKSILFEHGIKVKVIENNSIIKELLQTAERF